MKLLLENPDQYKRLVADPELIGNFIEETLRILSPVYTMWRVVTRDTVLGGVSIPKDALVMVRFGSANHDEAIFANGDAFDIDRDNAKKHIAFGWGIHLCIGAQLGRKEMLVAYRTLFSRLKNWRFAPGKNDFTHHPSVLLRGLKKLELEFDRA